MPILVELFSRVSCRREDLKRRRHTGSVSARGRREYRCFADVAVLPDGDVGSWRHYARIFTGSCESIDDECVESANGKDKRSGARAIDRSEHATWSCDSS